MAKLRRPPYHDLLRQMFKTSRLPTMTSLWLLHISKSKTTIKCIESDQIFDAKNILLDPFLYVYSVSRCTSKYGCISCSRCASTFARND